MHALTQCRHRHVDADGAILCDRIKQGDREVKPELCRACPVATIDCSLLRATLSLHSRPPIRVRYGNGKTDIWAGEEPTLTLDQAACSQRVIPILSPRDCSGCHLRQSLSQPSIPSPRSRVVALPAILAAGSAPAAPPPRKTRPAIQMAAWLEKERSAPRVAAPVVAPHVPEPTSSGKPFADEKRVGWTD